MYFFFVLFTLFCLILLMKMINEANREDVLYHAISIDQLPRSFQGTKIFFITDIHKRKISDKIIDEVVKDGVDIVIIGGDLAEKGVPLAQIQANVQKLCSIAPTYFVWGNNDYETAFRDLDALLINEGVKILDNTAVAFDSIQGEQIHLLGLDDVSRKRHRLEHALEDSGDGFKILVCHDPAIGKCIKDDHNIKLLLAGHTHGGQIRIFGWGITPKAGLLEKGIFTEFISNGYGTTRIPLRLGAPAQTHIIELKTK